MKRKSIFIALFFSFLLVNIWDVLSAENSLYVELEQAKNTLDASLYFEPLSGELLFSKNELSASLSLDSSLLFYSDASCIFLKNPPKKEGGKILISKESMQELKKFFNIREKREKIEGGKESFGYTVGAILIDPGHGGKDPGCVGSYTENGKNKIVYEKDIALSVSLNLYNKLKKTYPDKNIQLTRNGDYYPTVPERVKKANSIKVKKNEAILYISIHANASLNNRAQGFEVWYLPPEYRRNVLEKNEETKEIHTILNSMMEEEYTMESILMSKYVLDGLNREIGDVSRNRGIKEEEYIVVKNVKMPSILVELGFVTNKEEAKRLCTPSYLEKCTQGIYSGLVSFIHQFESSSGFIAR